MVLMISVVITRFSKESDAVIMIAEVGMKVEQSIANHGKKNDTEVW